MSWIQDQRDREKDMRMKNEKTIKLISFIIIVAEID